ncbi:MAG: hypothetical protein AAGA48_29725 [Myxococcota bacterium]
MSRAYEIRVARSLTSHKRIEDGIEARLELLPILDRERTGSLLAEQLKERGWTIEEGVAKREVDGVKVEVDTTTGTITLRTDKDLTITVEGERRKRSWDERATQDQKVLEQELDQALERSVEEKTQKELDQLSEQLERVLTEIKPELDQATDAVNRTALREKAAQLGQIMDIAEDGESGEMTIRVKV